MRSPLIPALKTLIPLFAEKPSHPVVPLGHRTPGARSAGQGRPPAGACALPLTAASTLAGWRQSGGRAILRYVGLLLAGVLALGACPVPVSAQAAPVAHANPFDPYAGFVTEASQRFGIPEHWIRAVLRAESAGDVRAVSPAGAMGLMQVVPDTWAGLRVRHGLGRDPYDPRDSIMAGAAYLREMWDRYGNVAAMLAAYNAGPGRYDEHRATGRRLPAETRAYVAAIAPVIGGAVAAETPAPAPPPPPDWRAAPLFVARSTGTRTAAAPSSEAQSGDIRATVPVRDAADTEPPTGSIFVARADDGSAP
ncbi:lytic transglycosylase domain-containing protein [Brucellaceae bacterium VT-16-1752]|nr:lytic transglycosylase domain-containing protein [Brucellaceae bacterium VT-16-1752]